MRYIYRSAWVLVGGVMAPPEGQSHVLYEREGEKVLLMHSPDDELIDIDRSSALGNLLLRGIFHAERASSLDAALAERMSEIRTERNTKINSGAVIVVSAEGPAEATIGEASRETEEFIVAFDAFEREGYVDRHQPLVEAAKSAISLEANNAVEFQKLVESVYLINDEEKPIYSVGINASVQAFAFSPYSSDFANRVSARVGALASTKDIRSVIRLHADSSRHNANRLKSFLSGWNALEILIAKAFRRYEDEFLAPLKGDGGSPHRAEFLKRLKSVMGGKYRILDKFAVVSAMLFPDATEGEAQRDLDTFSELKKMRDGLMHGDPISEGQLPIDRLRTMLNKYLEAYTK